MSNIKVGCIPSFNKEKFYDSCTIGGNLNGGYRGSNLSGRKIDTVDEELGIFKLCGDHSIFFYIKDIDETFIEETYQIY